MDAKEDEVGRFSRLALKMEYGPPGLSKEEFNKLREAGDIPYVKREILVDLENLGFMQIEQSSSDVGTEEYGPGCSLFLAGHRTALNMPLEKAHALRDSWVKYHGITLTEIDDEGVVDVAGSVQKP